MPPQLQLEGQRFEKERKTTLEELLDFIKRHPYGVSTTELIEVSKHTLTSRQIHRMLRTSKCVRQYPQCLWHGWRQATIWYPQRVNGKESAFENQNQEPRGTGS